MHIFKLRSKVKLIAMPNMVI